MKTYDAADRAAIRAQAACLRRASACLADPASRAQVASRMARQAVARRRARWQGWPALAGAPGEASPAVDAAAADTTLGVLRAVEDLEAVLVQLAADSPDDAAALDRTLAEAVDRAARELTADELRALTRDLLLLGRLLGIEPAPRAAPRQSDHFRPPLRRLPNRAGGPRVAGDGPAQDA